MSPEDRKEVVEMLKEFKRALEMEAMERRTANLRSWNERLSWILPAFVLGVLLGMVLLSALAHH